MHKQQKFLLAIVLIGGVAVLGSYALGILAIQNATQILWGDVPKIIRSFSTLGMFTGALGFFAYTFFILFKLNPDNTRIYSRFGYEIFKFLYIAILIPSALWLPLTFLAVQNNNSIVLWLARLDLIVVAAASILLLLALLYTQPRKPAWAYRLALVGSIFFCVQTVLLDAILWGYFFGF
jgi:hypothetical protein